MRYIHEHDNWWEFRYDAGRLINLLGDIRARQGALLGQLQSLGFDTQANASLENLSLDIIKSSEIEGEVLSLEHVRSSIARRLGIDTSGMPQPSRYIDGVVDMMMDAASNYSNPLSDSRLFGWHSVLFPTGRSGLYEIEVARYRTGDMQVVSGPMGMERVHYEAPSPQRVPAEMARFINWINEENDLDAVLKAAIAHLWFVTIHPFDDGNGRIARAITDMLLARADGSKLRFYSMSNAMCQHRKGYYDALEHAQHGDGDITEWIEWFLLCLRNAIDASQSTLEQAMRKNRFWQEHGNMEFNPRQVKIINAMLDGWEGNMTTSRWSRMCHCSRDTALRDATDLLKRGILQLGQGGGRSTSYELTHL